VWTTSYEEANRLVELSDSQFIDTLNNGLSVHFNLVKYLNVLLSIVLETFMYALGRKRIK